MRRLTNDQRGLTPVVIAIIIAVLAALGAAGYFLAVRDGSEPSASTTDTSTTESPESRSGTDDNSFSGSYFDAISTGRPLQCDWRAPESAGGNMQVGFGRFYTDGVSRGRSEGKFEIAGGQSNAYAVFTDDYIYNWFELPGGQKSGTKIKRSAAETTDMTDEQKQQSLDIRAQYSFSCQPWTVDESKLAPPSDVMFQDV